MAISDCIDLTDDSGRELVSHGTADYPAACYHDDLKALPVSWHWHEELEVLIVSEGCVLAAAGGERVTLHEGEGIFVNAGVLHADWPGAPGTCRLHSIVFHPRLVGGGADSIFWQKYLQPLLTDPMRPCAVLRPDVSWQREALDAVERAFQAQAQEPDGYEFAVREALSRMIFLLHAHAPALRPLPRKARRSAERIKTMMQYVQDRYAEDIALSDIAASAAISPSECLRCFHDTLGTTPSAYLRNFRIRRAAELLCGTGLRVTDIAVQCGFADSSYFARSFRQVYACGPVEYRRRARREP